MDTQRIAAFSKNHRGGNPAGVVLLDTPISEAKMQKVAAEVGYSETVFAVPLTVAGRSWRVRYFSPESEVPFCGHATIALGVALGQRDGPGSYKLELNNAEITVDATTSAEGMSATLTSARNSSVRFSLIVRLLCCNKCYQRSGIKPRQVQAHAAGSRRPAFSAQALAETLDYPNIVSLVGQKDEERLSEKSLTDFVAFLDEFGFSRRCGDISSIDEYTSYFSDTQNEVGLKLLKLQTSLSSYT